MKKNIVIIPARGGSKRLPNKNSMLFDGIPLLAHSILYAKNHSFVDEVIVSTDDEKIKEIGLQFNSKVIDRPNELSGDFEPTVSALSHVLACLDYEVENVILLQPTNPLRPDTLLKNAFNIFCKKHYDSLFTVSKSEKKLGKIIDNNFIPFNYKIGQRSQDLEPLYFENGLLYITKASLIKKQIIISENAFPLEINHIFATIDIDTQEDFDMAEYIYNLHKR